MRFRCLLVGLMVTSFSACDLVGDRRAVTLAGEARSTSHLGPAADSDVLLRRLSVSADDVDLFDAAPDGSFLVALVHDTGDLAVVDTRSRDVRVLNPRGWSVGWAEGARVSPDGDRIAYNWHGTTAAGGDGWVYQLRIINVDGSGDHLLRQSEFTMPYGWTRDGWILAVEQGQPNKILLISEWTGDARVVKDLGLEWPSRAALSSDGRYIAYSLPENPDSPAHDIYVLSVADGRETRVTRSDGHDVVLDWVPGEDAILLYADRGVWRLALSEGEAAGPPELLRADVWDMRALGVSSEGLMYEVDSGDRGIYSVPLDLEASTAAGPVTLVGPRGRFPAWSPDSRLLAYRPGVRAPGPARIVVSTMDSDEQREYTFRSAGPLQWHPDGRSIFALGGQSPTTEGLYELDLATGKTDFVCGNGAVSPSVGLSPDGRMLYFGEGRSIMAQDLETCAVREVYRSESVGRSGRISVSPDGLTLAFREGGGAGNPVVVKIVPAAGGAARIVFQIPDRWFMAGDNCHFPWTPDGRHVLISGAVPDAGLTIVRVPVDGGEPTTLLTHEQPGMAALSLSPDGRRAAFVSELSRKEIWLLQGF